jgi:hypothetical protein
MSETTTPSRGAGDKQRRRSRRGRGRRQHNEHHHGQHSQAQHSHTGGQSGRRQGQAAYAKNRSPKQPPLTWWQKLLKAIGLYRPAVAPVSKPSSQPTPTREPKSNTRIVTTQTESPRAQPTPATAPPRQQAVESPRLYVGNLSYDAAETDLEELFKGFGSVRNVEIVYNRRTHRSKGYAFVTMHHLDDAKRAVGVLHDQPFMGRKLIVNGAVSDGPAGGDDDDDSDDE